jgi:hypothetical protein
MDGAVATHLQLILHTHAARSTHIMKVQQAGTLTCYSGQSTARWHLHGVMPFRLVKEKHHDRQN